MDTYTAIMVISLIIVAVWLSSKITSKPVD